MPNSTALLSSLACIGSIGGILGTCGTGVGALLCALSVVGAVSACGAAIVECSDISCDGHPVNDTKIEYVSIKCTSNSCPDKTEFGSQERHFKCKKKNILSAEWVLISAKPAVCPEGYSYESP